MSQIVMKQQIREAVAEATRRGKLRSNSVDSITGENSGDNLGPGTPIIHFEQWERDDIEVKLILKGGGCENMNAQYSVPTELPGLGRADRTLEGVRTAFVPRHGRGHRYLPTEVPYPANLWALKSLGLQYVVSVSAMILRLLSAGRFDAMFGCGAGRRHPPPRKPSVLVS